MEKKWTGYSFKLELMMEYKSDDEIICFIDSFDVILLRPIQELESFFTSYHSLTGVRLIVGYDIRPSHILLNMNLDCVMEYH